MINVKYSKFEVLGGVNKVTNRDLIPLFSNHNKSFGDFTGIISNRWIISNIEHYIHSLLIRDLWMFALPCDQIPVFGEKNADTDKES